MSRVYCLLGLYMLMKVGGAHLAAQNNPEAVAYTAWGHRYLSTASLTAIVPERVQQTEKLTALFEMTQHRGCVPHEVTFTDLSYALDAAIINWSWDFGDGTTAQGPQPTHRYTQSGTYTVYLQVTTVEGDTVGFVHPQPIEVWQAPSATFSVRRGQKEIQVIAGSSGSVPVSTWQWQLNDGQTAQGPAAHFRTEAFDVVGISLQVEDQRGCRDSLQQVIRLRSPHQHPFNCRAPEFVMHQMPDYPHYARVLPRETLTFSADAYDWSLSTDWETRLYPSSSPTASRRTAAREMGMMPPATFNVPAAFTPDGDGQHDTFAIEGEQVDQVALRIYSRWGQLVFATNTLQTAWNGTYEGRTLPEGTYVYTLKGQGKNGEPIDKKGHLTLIR